MTKTKETERRRSYAWPESNEFRRYNSVETTHRIPSGAKDEDIYYRVRYCHVGFQGRNLMGTYAKSEPFETMQEALEELRKHCDSYLGAIDNWRYRCVIVERSADGGKTYPHWLIALSTCPGFDPYPRQRFLRTEP